MRVIISVIAMIVLLAGCKKDSGETIKVKNPEELLTQQSWTINAYGFDENNNEVIDEDENRIQDCEKDNKYVFNQSGTGSVSEGALSCGAPVNSNFAWSFLNNSTKLEIEQEKLSVLRLNEQELILSPDLPGLRVRFILHYGH